MASFELPMNAHSLRYRLTDVNEPIQRTSFISKVSMSTPEMNHVAPVGELILLNKRDWVIQRMRRKLIGTEVLQQPIKIQDHFFQKLPEARETLEVVTAPSICCFLIIQ